MFQLKDLNLSQFGYSSNEFVDKQQAINAYNNITSTEDNVKKLADLVRETCGYEKWDKSKKIKVDFDVDYKSYYKYSGSFILNWSLKFKGYYIIDFINRKYSYQSELVSGTYQQTSNNYIVYDLETYKQEQVMDSAFIEFTLNEKCTKWLVNLKPFIDVYYILKMVNEDRPQQREFGFDLKTSYYNLINSNIPVNKYVEPVINKSIGKDYPVGECKHILEYEYENNSQFQSQSDYSNYSCTINYKVDLYNENSNVPNIDPQIINELNF